jgi:hypothetical protein
MELVRSSIKSRCLTSVVNFSFTAKNLHQKHKLTLELKELDLAALHLYEVHYLTYAWTHAGEAPEYAKSQSSSMPACAFTATLVANHPLSTLTFSGSEIQQSAGD